MTRKGTNFFIGHVSYSRVLSYCVSFYVVYYVVLHTTSLGKVLLRTCHVTLTTQGGLFAFYKTTSGKLRYYVPGEQYILTGNTVGFNIPRTSPHIRY